MSKEPKRSSTLKSALRVASGTALSRFLGLGRDISIALFFGLSVSMDAFFIAFLIPNLFRKLFGEGALSAAVIPVLTEYREKRSEKEAEVLVSKLATLLVVFLSVVTLIGTLFVWILPGAWFGFADPEKWAAFQQFFLILAPMVVFLCVSGLQAGVLNTYGNFWLPSVLPALHNLIWIGSIVLAVSLPALEGEPIQQISLMCGGVLFGTIVQWWLQLRALRNLGLKLSFRFGGDSEGVTRIFRAMGPTLLALAIFQINTLLDLLLAEWLVDGHGAVSAYSYASRLFQFPLGIVGIALGTAIFPMLSRYAARGEAVKVTGGLLNGVRLLAFIVFPAAAGLIALNDEIVATMFQRGEFDAESTARTARILIFFSIALPLVAALQLITKAFYALKDTRTPTRVALWAVGVNLTANVILVQTPLEEAGLALGTAISSAFNLVVLSLILAKKLKGTIVESRRLRAAGDASDRLANPLSRSGIRRLQLSLLRSLLFSVLMGGLVVFLKRLLPFEGGDNYITILSLIGVVCAGMVVYFLLHIASGANELKDFRKQA